MRRTIAILLLVGLMASCSSHKATTTQTGEQSESNDQRLKLTAYPRQGFAPMRVSLNASLEGVSKNDEGYYCLQEEWEFGDGAVSSEQANCEPFGDGSEVKTNFFAEHVYSEKGTYTVWFTLGENKIRSNQIAVVVLESEIGNQ